MNNEYKIEEIDIAGWQGYSLFMPEDSLF